MMMTAKNKEKMWDDLIQEYRNSGKIAEVWCKSRNLKLNRLRYWIRKQNQKKNNFKTETPKIKGKITEPEWIELERNNLEKNSSSILIKIGIASIEVPEEFSTETLSKVLKAFGIAI